MKKRILLVEREEETLAQFQKAIGSRFDLFAVSTAEEALEACRTVGPFAVAIAEHGLADLSAFELLRRVNEGWPETIGLLIAPEADPSVAMRAVQEAHVFRCVTAPCSAGSLLSAVGAALVRHDEADRAEAISEEIRFGKDSMAGFNALLEERLERQDAGQRRLHRFARDLGSVRSGREIARLTAEATSEALGGRGVQVLLWQASLHGEDVGAGAGSEMSASMHRTPIAVPSGEIGEICVDLYGPHGEKLSPAEASLVTSFSTSAAIAVHHETARRDLDQAQHATVLALARLAERRDTETGRHLDRVAGYCRLVAEGLRARGIATETITDEYVDDLACSSALHDIGKVGIPDSILLKPGLLTPGEWEIMKTHAEIGGATLDSVVQGISAPGFLTMGRDIAWGHHEKWDGSGYPRGLRGSDIPLSARIVALADVYDALTTVRPYKQAWPHADAVEWILSRSGSHFDPDVTAAFAEHLEEADHIRATLADPPHGVAKPQVELAAIL